MAITWDYSIDELRLASVMDDGWTHVELFTCPSPEGEYATTGVRAELVVGTYEYELAYSSGSEAAYYKIAFWNGVSNSSLLGVPVLHGEGGTTLARMRQRLGLLLGDMDISTTTGNGAVDGSTAISDRALFTRRRDDFFKNRFFHRTSGGDQEWTQITGWDQSDAKFTLAPAVSTQIASGASFEVTARWTPEEYRDAINWGIRAAYPVLQREIVYDGLRTVDQRLEYKLPNHIRSVSNVMVARDANSDSTDPTIAGLPFTDVPFKPLTSGLGTYITLHRAEEGGKRMRVLGMGPLLSLYADTDYVEIVDPQVDLVLYLAAFDLYTHLTGTAAASDRDLYREQAKLYMGMFQNYKSQFSPGRRGKQMWQHEHREANEDWRTRPR